MRIDVCPRCFAPGALVVDERGYNTYVYVVHSEGKKKRKCYLGPKVYKYVTATHERDGLVLMGMEDQLRIGYYVTRGLERLVKMTPVGPEEKRKEFEEARWRVLLRALEILVEGMAELGAGDTARCLQLYEALEKLQRDLKRCLEGIPTSSRW